MPSRFSQTGEPPGIVTEDPPENEKAKPPDLLCVLSVESHVCPSFTVAVPVAPEPGVPDHNPTNVTVAADV